MSKEEFLKNLEQLLFDIPKEEKEEALRYYQDYFEDAVGVDEDKIIKEIGTPEKVARQIKVNLYNKASNEAGVYTETGYSNAFFEDGKEEIDLVGNVQGQQNKEQQYSNTAYGNNNYGNSAYGNQQYGNATNQRSANKSSNNILLIIVLVLTCPIWGGAAFGIIVGLAATVFGLTIGFGAAFLGLLIGGIVLVGTGIGQVFVNPLAGMLLIGCGFILLALAICFLSLVMLITTKLIPAIVKGIRFVWDKLFGRRERA
ncbi:MAG: DUF1700 domain-containing protein [bacterium]|nr:DUF1700 domain-containing protein [bacterium]